MNVFQDSGTLQKLPCFSFYINKFAMGLNDVAMAGSSIIFSVVTFFQWETMQNTTGRIAYCNLKNEKNKAERLFFSTIPAFRSHVECWYDWSLTRLRKKRF